MFEGLFSRSLSSQRGELRGTVQANNKREREFVDCGSVSPEGTSSKVCPELPQVLEGTMHNISSAPF
jgi:hypothetical protein